MLSLSRPTEGEVIAYLIDRRDAPFTYAEVGATATEPPAGYNVDRERVCLGKGRDVFERAKAAICRWEMFPQPMAQLMWPEKPIREGEVVAVLFRAIFLWSLNPTRIVYTVDDSDEHDDVHRFGFAYGTLPGHVERGEERFLVEWDRGDDRVWYDLLAFSKPHHVLAKLGYPYARRMQAQFRTLSGQAMQRAVMQHMESAHS